ncbi:MAG: hypothetical protein AB8A49_00490 [Prochlorococcus sp.]|jgi:host factor-I protein|nr:hypothetical protein [Prochlorococcaceae cyanobacterium ETNP2_MAG_10]HJO78588.1 hypothetical protein [Prochlorococcaceae cyanobacterium Fu_MAG_134]
MENHPLNPSLPGVRLIQGWVRDEIPLSIELPNGLRLEGRLLWQDPEFLALERPDSPQPVLINRRAVLLIRPLG